MPEATQNSPVVARTSAIVGARAPSTAIGAEGEVLLACRMAARCASGSATNSA